MIINDPKKHKTALKHKFELMSERTERREPLAQCIDYRTDRHFQLRCKGNPWYEIEIDVSIYRDCENGYFQNCKINYITVDYNHPEYGLYEIASNYDFETYDCRTDMQDDILRELVTAYGIISTI